MLRPPYKRVYSGKGQLEVQGSSAMKRKLNRELQLIDPASHQFLLDIVSLLPPNTTSNLRSPSFSIAFFI